MKKFILVIFLAVIMASCAFFLPIPPPNHTHTVVMWCDTDNKYTEWEVREDYFYCTESGTVWRFAD